MPTSRGVAWGSDNTKLPAHLSPIGTLVHLSVWRGRLLRAIRPIASSYRPASQLYTFFHQLLGAGVSEEEVFDAVEATFCFS